MSPLARVPRCHSSNFPRKICGTRIASQEPATDSSKKASATHIFHAGKPPFLNVKVGKLHLDLFFIDVIKVLVNGKGHLFSNTFVHYMGVS